MDGWGYYEISLAKRCTLDYTISIMVVPNPGLEEVLRVRIEEIQDQYLDYYTKDPKGCKKMLEVTNGLLENLSPEMYVASVLYN